MNDAQIRQLIQSEVMKANQQAKFNLNVTPSHFHTGKGGDAPQISQSDVIPNQRCEGSITMATQTTYKIGITFNPSSVWVHGNVTGPNGEEFMIVGNAQLGPSYYLQPQNATSVITGGPQQNVIQSNTYFGLDSLGAVHTLVDEGHIVNVNYKVSGVMTFFVRGTITDFSNTAITVSFVGGTNKLTSGWTVNLSWTIT